MFLFKIVEFGLWLACKADITADPKLTGLPKTQILLS